MSPSIADVTGPHPRDEAITFSWARTWVPAMGAVLALALGAAAGWYSLRAEAQETKAEAHATARRVEAAEKRTDEIAAALEQRTAATLAALETMRTKLDEISRKQDRLICKRFPDDCPR